MWLKRKDREQYHMMKFEDALTDAAFEMVHSGDMTEDQERQWYAFFAARYDMKGLIPGRDGAAVKRGIRARLRFWEKRKPTIPGPIPGVEVDPTYNPKTGKEVSFKSKYVR